MSAIKHYIGWVQEVVPPVDPGFGQGFPLPPHPGGGPVYPGGPVDPGYGHPGWGPVDPGYGRPGWSPVDPGYGHPGGGHPAQPLPPGGIVGGGPIVPPYVPANPIELPPGSALPPDQIWPAPPNTIWPPKPPRPGDKPQPPIVIPPGKIAIAVWVSGYGRYFTIIDKPSASVEPEPEPKK